MRRFSKSPTNCPGARAALVALTLVAASALSPSARAQTIVEPEFTVQRFSPAAGPRNFIVTRGARTDGKMAWSAGLFANYAYKPLEVRTCVVNAENGTCESTSSGVVSNLRDVDVVENLITADLMGTLTPTPILQLGLRVPVTWLRGQQTILPGGFLSEEALSAFALGDPELEVKLRAYGSPTSPFVLGVAAYVTAPVGYAIAEDKFVGDRTPTAGGRVIIDGARGPFSYAVNLGGAYRGTSQVGSAEVGSEARYSAAVGYQVSSVLRPVLDVYGSTRFSGTSGENALEGLGALQIQPRGTGLVITAGAGTRFITGIGAPTVRAMLGVAFISEKSDTDGDGIDDKLDQCPTEAEDLDGYEDSDGCPDRDNDLDGIPDVDDKCPLQAEDQDGFEDTDGCPDLDNDQDGFPDTGDQCPLEAETRNNYKDEDGCPDESDVDSDGVPDERDKCPNEPEDTDGFEDTDGCPDPDNDQDGIPDEQDECIDEPETINEFEDTDGCPDEAPAGGKKKR